MNGTTEQKGKVGSKFFPGALHFGSSGNRNDIDPLFHRIVQWLCCPLFSAGFSFLFVNGRPSLVGQTLAGYATCG
jgi:hypothetical protein